MKPSASTRWLATALAVLALLAGTLPAVAAAPRRAGRDPWAGEWAGTWQSAHGHHGRLLCTLAPAGAGRWRAEFTAFWLSFHKGYTIEFPTRREKGTLHFAGRQNLGWAYGGVYRCEGTVTPGRFSATYRSAWDRGVFSLARPKNP